MSFGFEVESLEGGHSKMMTLYLSARESVEGKRYRQERTAIAKSECSQLLHLFLSANRESKIKGGPFPFLAIHPDPSSVSLHHHFTNRQSKTGSLITGTFPACGLTIFLKQLVNLLGGYSNPVVLNP